MEMLGALEAATEAASGRLPEGCWEREVSEEMRGMNSAAEARSLPLAVFTRPLALAGVVSLGVARLAFPFFPALPTSEPEHHESSKFYWVSGKRMAKSYTLFQC